jgi:hypothetical protein
MLAGALHAATDGLAGPQILSDKQFRPRSLVHSRYGAFRGRRRLTDDGKLVIDMIGPDGSAVSDINDIGLDYATGPAGVLDFLVRLRYGGPNPWWPSLCCRSVSG